MARRPERNHEAYYYSSLVAKSAGFENQLKTIAAESRFTSESCVFSIFLSN